MSKITAMYIRLSMEDEDVSLNQKEESNSVSSQRELLESFIGNHSELKDCLLYTSPSPRDAHESRMPSSA